MENETVRTRVMLASGDQTPATPHQHLCHVHTELVCGSTSIETMKTLSLVCVEDAVGEGLELVAVLVRSRTGTEGAMAYACRRVFTESRGY